MQAAGALSYPPFPLFSVIPAKQSVQKPYGHPANKAYSATPMPPLAIPAQSLPLA